MPGGPIYKRRCRAARLPSRHGERLCCEPVRPCEQRTGRRPQACAPLAERRMSDQRRVRNRRSAGGRCGAICLVRRRQGGYGRSRSGHRGRPPWAAAGTARPTHPRRIRPAAPARVGVGPQRRGRPGDAAATRQRGSATPGTPDRPAADRAAARTLHVLGQPVRHGDEAGLVSVAGRPGAAPHRRRSGRARRGEAALAPDVDPTLIGGSHG